MNNINHAFTQLVDKELNSDLVLEMLRGADLGIIPHLTDAMLIDRKRLFIEDLGWDISADENGREIDQYDGDHAVYVIIRDALGNHRGSARLMPTVSKLSLIHISEPTRPY